MGNHFNLDLSCSREDVLYVFIIFEPQREKTCLPGAVNNTGADQPAHPRRLISAFIFRYLESIVC